MARLVLCGQNGLHGSSERIQSEKEFVRTGQILQMPPIAFDGIEVRAASGKIDDPNTMLKKAQGGSDRRTMMIRGIVHHQDNPLGGIAVYQQILQKLNEGEAVLPVDSPRRDMTRTPIVGSNDMLIVTEVGGSRQFGLLAAFHPALAKGEA